MGLAASLVAVLDLGLQWSQAGRGTVWNWQTSSDTLMAAGVPWMRPIGVACVAVVLPWTARNCARLDGCALVSVNGGSNLWIGTDPTAEGNYRDLRFGEGCDRTHGEVAKDRCYGREAREPTFDPVKRSNRPYCDCEDG